MTNAAAELMEWYAEGLRPKLARATRARLVRPAEVAALDERMRALLDVPEPRTRTRAKTPRRRVRAERARPSRAAA